MARAADPEACQSFAGLDLGLPAWDRAFGVANGMAWSRDAAQEEKIRRGARLAGILRDLYVEELGWQSHRRRAAAALPLEAALALIPEAQRCLFVHGRARGLSGGRASDAEALELARRFPAACRVHALHAALRYRDLHDENPAADPALRLVAPEEADALRALDVLP
jgi:hypothetical protein